MAKPRNRDKAVVQKGERLKRVREMIDITSQQLADKTGFSRQSVSYWENGNQNGLSYGGAEATIQLAKKYGIECDFNWLWRGVGNEPYFLSEGLNAELTTAAQLDNTIHSTDTRSKEIELFQQNGEEVVFMLVKHDAMKPLYQKDDWVGGYWRAISPKLIGQPCIVEIAGNLEVRLVKKRTTKGYHLCFMTYSEGTLEAFEIEDHNPVRVAPVVRVWR